MRVLRFGGRFFNLVAVFSPRDPEHGVRSEILRILVVGELRGDDLYAVMKITPKNIFASNTSREAGWNVLFLAGWEPNSQSTSRRSTLTFRSSTFQGRSGYYLSNLVFKHKRGSAPPSRNFPTWTFDPAARQRGWRCSFQTSSFSLAQLS